MVIHQFSRVIVVIYGLLLQEELLMTKAPITEDALYSDIAYDDAFRTMETECDDLLLPYVNYAFDENYGREAKVKHLRNEHFIEHEDHSQEKRITDSHFEVEQNGLSKRYHLECESKPYDRSILIRIFEYDAQIAVDTAITDESKLYVRFPRSGLLLLRSNSKTPDEASVVISTPKDEVAYNIPIVKVSDFTIDEIFEKKLFLLIPFFIFNFEKDLEEINKSDERVNDLKDLYRDILSRLERLQTEDALSSLSCGVIISMTHKVLHKLTMNHEIVQQKVGDVMGGKVIDLPIIRVYHQGKDEGLAEGMAAGEAERKRLEEENESLRRELESLKAQVL